MLRTDFSYELPQELIAQHPLKERSASRLLCLDGKTGAIQDLTFRQLPSLLEAGDLLVLNDSRVVAARLHGEKATGGRVEILIERVLDEYCALVQLKASRAPKVESRLRLDGGNEATVLENTGRFFKLGFDERIERLLEQQGHVPLPPYIQRADEPEDLERYQTIYARNPGAVAAPTAGLHFDEILFQALADRGIERVFVTLHVGAGTFQPVRERYVEAHRMHSEYVTIDERVCDAVRGARARGGRVVAVGTTAVRSLETAAAAGAIRPFHGETSLFIFPGYRFRAVDALITNFHLPESTLLMLVCAFAGTEKVLSAYAHAVETRYRFFSYGDAMWVTPEVECTNEV